MKKEGSDLEIKQVFLANAITDISAYIQLVDTKVSIIGRVKEKSEKWIRLY